MFEMNGMSNVQWPFGWRLIRHLAERNEKKTDRLNEGPK